MAIVESLSAVFLCVVFLIAGTSKLCGVHSTAKGFSALGISGRLVVPVALAEFLSAIALLVRPRTGAVAALLLLVAFTGVLLRVMARSARLDHMRAGATVRCNCFGGGDRAGVVGVQSLVRNAVLVGCALAAAGTERLRLEVPPLPAALTILSTVATAEVVRQLLRIRAATGRLLPSMERSR